jgi:hypothetical protein
MIISSIIYCIFFEISLIEICKKNYWLLIMEKRRDIYIVKEMQFALNLMRINKKVNFINYKSELLLFIILIRKND